MLAGMLLLHGCGTGAPKPSANYSGVSAQDALSKAQGWATHAEHQPDQALRADAWMNCAMLAHDAMTAAQVNAELAAAALATRCSRAYLEAIMQNTDLNLHAGHMLLNGRYVDVQFRSLPDSLGEHVHMELANRINMQVLDGTRYQQQGFGVTMVAAAPPCTHRPVCSLYPPEGIFRPATVWLEAAPDPSHAGEQPVLVVQNPLAQPLHSVGNISYQVAEDVSAPYEQLLERSKLRRLGWWGLIGGQAVGRRAGLFLLDDYDPNKTPVIMIHGLGSSPLIWAPLSNAIMGDAELHRRYQIWHVVYQSNAALLIERARVQSYLDATWKILDPAGTAPARHGVVLVGHSMGGVIARLLCAQSTPALWSAAFTVPFGSLHGSADDLATLKSVFEFQPYAGVDELVFMASPQHGSPVAGDWFGRLAQDLAWHHIPEMEKLQRISQENPGAVQASLITGTYRISHLSSVTSLMPDEPVSMVDETLMPAVGVRYHNIAGSLAGEHPPSDGYVPLASALLPGAASSLIIDADHHGVPRDPKAIAAVLQILRKHDIPVAVSHP
ncbi:esterase/lipase family protein [Dyella acidiphila]|uniref:Alpha/beta hydrolase n=1 Tax=Dyella acidiphila TaxID=2775866 RepID=A0ABR9G9R3_9GAMM|nr:alpha/beta hydrolase [Dyella acidiphila]MBE1160761.1 alpha/beta hydrolase [Dyella acidiphila]